MIKNSIIFENHEFCALTKKQHNVYTRLIPANTSIQETVDVIVNWILEDCVKFHDEPTNEYLEVRVGNKSDCNDKKKMKFVHNVSELKTAITIYLMIGYCAFEDFCINTYTKSHLSESHNCYTLKSATYNQ